MENTIEYKCPNCKAPLKYNINSEKVTCDYCGSEFNIADVRSYSEELKKSKADEVFWNSEKKDEYTEDELNKLNVYRCSGCNGEIIADENTSATKCPFCDSPVILKGRLSGALKPDYIIPFKKNVSDAKTNFFLYLKNKILLPRVFRTETTFSEIKGLYVPYWVYDSLSSGEVTYIGENHHRHRDSEYEYIETEYFEIERHGSVSFSKVPQDASKNIDDALMESIEPFDFTEAVKFDTPYLSGYYSDKYDVSKEDAFKRVHKRVIDGTINEFRKTVRHYDHIRTIDYNLNVKNTNTFYCLYPIWLLNIKWNGNNYNFAMNGETGKIKGDLPMSKAKFSLAILILFLLGGLIGVLFGLLANGFYFDEGIIALGIILGIVASIVGTFILKRQLKGVKLKNGASDYCNHESLNITYRNDRFLRRSVSRRRINNNDGHHGDPHGGPHGGPHGR